MTYTQEQITQMAKTALEAEKKGDARFFLLVMQMAMRVKAHPDVVVAWIRQQASVAQTA